MVYATWRVDKYFSKCKTFFRIFNEPLFATYFLANDEDVSRWMILRLMNIAFDLTFFMTDAFSACILCLCTEPVQQIIDSNNENMFHIKMCHKFYRQHTRKQHPSLNRPVKKVIWIINYPADTMSTSRKDACGLDKNRKKTMFSCEIFQRMNHEMEYKKRNRKMSWMKCEVENGNESNYIFLDSHVNHWSVNIFHMKNSK